jgi:phosphoribosylanthranilate isomerase
MALIKFCGLRVERDIEYANICLPDYIGFVFAESRRKLSLHEAVRLRAGLDPRIRVVGVFANAETGFVREVFDRGAIDIAQFHGGEDDEYIAAAKAALPCPIIRAAGAGEGAAVIPSAGGADYMLFDTLTRGACGGGGKCFDWNLLKGVRGPYFLAGGLNAGNVIDAIRLLKPYCVDISSGIESGGFKDLAKMKSITDMIRRDGGKPYGC